MSTPTTLHQVRDIEYRARRLVTGSFAGAYQSVFKGRGLQFTAVRPYDYGDDVRAIDWKVTARTGITHIKEFVEERELTIMIMLDASPSLFFGTVDRTKRDIAAELSAILAWCASVNNDRAGLLLFTDQIELLVPPRKGRHHIMRLIQDILTFQPVGKRTDLGLALRTAAYAIPRHSLIFIISDFLDDLTAHESAFAIAGHRHHTTAFCVHDPLERYFPQIGVVGLQDSETRETLWVDTSGHTFDRTFVEQQALLHHTREAVFRRTHIQSLDLPLNQALVTTLRHYFHEQKLRRRA